MFNVILIFIAAAIILSVQSSRDKEIIVSSRNDVLEHYQKRLEGRVIGLLICAVVTICGFASDGWVWELLVGYPGIFLSFFMLLLVIDAALKKKRFSNMSDNEFTNLKIEKITEQNAKNAPLESDSLFETPPPCPRCGSAKTRTSDDYRAKAGARMAGGIVLGALLGNYTNFNFTQTYYAKQRFKQSIKIEKQYQCKNCGYIWSATPSSPQKTMVECTTAPKKKPQTSTSRSSSSEMSPEQQQNVKELRELLEAGILSQEEYDKTINKLLLS